MKKLMIFPLLVTTLLIAACSGHSMMEDHMMDSMDGGSEMMNDSMKSDNGMMDDSMKSDDMSSN